MGIDRRRHGIPLIIVLFPNMVYIHPELRHFRTSRGQLKVNLRTGLVSNESERLPESSRPSTPSSHRHGISRV